jgi:hypothetical protein
MNLDEMRSNLQKAKERAAAEGRKLTVDEIGAALGLPRVNNPSGGLSGENDRIKRGRDDCKSVDGGSSRR